MTIIRGMHDLNDFQAEKRAYEAFTKLLADASTVRSYFEAANMALPGPLSRFLGIGQSTANASRKAVIPHPPTPPLPPEFKSDWVWVRISNMTAYTLTLAMLRQAKGPMKPKSVLVRVQGLLPDINPRSVYNLGPRLKGVTVTNEGWSLDDPDTAPILSGDYAWGPASVFLHQELTIHRRSLILHLLRTAADGMMAMQIVRQLQDSGLCRTTVNKDLVKGDIEVLKDEGEVRRSSKKWKAVNEWSKESKYA